MSFEYADKLIDLLDYTRKYNEDNLKILIEKFAENIENDKMIHAFGTGHSHMVGIELYARAGGLGNVNAILDPDVIAANGVGRSGNIERLPGIADIIYDSYNIEKGDLVIITSNSGRNAAPIEFAMRCKKEGIYCVALTNLKQSQQSTSRHPSGKKLYEFADLVIDTCVPFGDGILELNGIRTGACTSIVTMFLMNIVVTEAIKLVQSHGKRPYVFQSQNVDGYNNEEIYEHFNNRIKHI